MEFYLEIHRHGYSVEEEKSRKRKRPTRCQILKGALFVSPLELPITGPQ